MDSELRLKWADFPVDEYESRLERVQQKMQDASLDVALITQQENVEYFSGFQTGHWNSKTFPTAFLLIHATKDPVLVLPDFFEGNANACSWIDNRVTVAEPHANPRGFGPAVVSAIRDLAGSSPVVGLEHGSHMTPVWNMADYEHVRSELTSAEFTSAAKPIWGTRMIKSDREIDRMTWLTALTDAAISDTRGRLEAGMTEVEIAASIQKGMLDRGADGAAFRNVRAGGDRYACSDSLPQERAIQDGDVLLIDIGATYKTYTTDVAYVSHIGPASGAHHQNYSTIIKAHEAALGAAKPGVPAKEVFQASLRVLEDSPLRTLDMCGHAIGMEVHEPPMLTPYDDTPLEPGMTFAVEPWLYDTEGLGIFCVEEIVQITEDGAHVLSSVPRDELLEVT
ncbi:MAG: Xaa-Pro peptidase family protein [Acidimicrobiia bacterium]